MALHGEEDRQREKTHHSAMQWGTTKLVAASAVISTIISSAAAPLIAQAVNHIK